jgi:hypothetical protein
VDLRAVARYWAFYVGVGFGGGLYGSYRDSKKCIPISGNAQQMGIIFGWLAAANGFLCK